MRCVLSRVEFGGPRQRGGGGSHTTWLLQRSLCPLAADFRVKRALKPATKPSSTYFLVPAPEPGAKAHHMQGDGAPRLGPAADLRAGGDRRGCR